VKRVLPVIRVLGVVALALLSSSCLRKEIESTWYIEADRRVVWSIAERDVRSEADSPDDRDADEDDFIAAVRANDHAVARGLRQFTPAPLTSRILRDRPPFSVITEAGFSSLATLGERLIGRFGLRGSSLVTFTREGYEWTWTLDADTRVDEDSLDDDLMAVFESQVIQLALAQGRFLESPGVTLSEDRRLATFPVNDLLDRHGKREGEATVFVVRWTDR
jgi:hypothetical protein